MEIEEVLAGLDQAHIESDFLVWEAERSRLSTDGSASAADSSLGSADCSRFEQVGPGPLAAVMLSSVGSLDRLSDAGVVGVLQALSRQMSFNAANVLEAVASVVNRYVAAYEDMEEAMVMAEAELRAALCLTRQAARDEIDLAYHVVSRTPALLTALRAGELDLRRVKVIVRESRDLNSEHARAVCNAVLTRAGGLTTGQLRAWIRRLRIDIAPDEALNRYKQAVEERCVTSELTEDGVAVLIASGLPPHLVAAFMNRLTRKAKSLRGPSEPRTIDQLRADAFIELMDGDESSGGKGVVDVRADLTTLMGLDAKAVELSGFGPVIADIGRQVTSRGITRHGGEWRFTITDSTGAALTTLTRRRPTASDRRIVESRDVACVFPGCRMPSTSCDLDHRVPFSEGGLTHPHQLVPLCRRDHVIRHKGWTHQTNGDGTIAWRSPFGVVYTTIRAP